jgi:hypothetical protein
MTNRGDSGERRFAHFCVLVVTVLRDVVWRMSADRRTRYRVLDESSNM